ncbi:MAG: phosphatase PAP2 family protein [Erythrobacter sp.]|nr:phosphatase PAP2 family protein [Erythrobacter sp.]
MQLATLKAVIRREYRLLVGIAIGAGLAALFLKLAGEMSESETEAVDIAILKALRLPSDPAVPIGPSWLLGSMRDLTALGSVTVLTLVSVLAVAFLLMRGRWHQALYTALATGGGAVMGKVLKTLFARERPEIVPHLVEVHSLSFPSGHSTNSAIVYLTLAVLLARSFEDQRSRLFVIATAALLVLTIGITRVYLGVHYPSDVLGGWTIGAAWALGAGLVAGRLQARQRIEAPGPSGEA